MRINYSIIVYSSNINVGINRFDIDEIVKKNSSGLGSDVCLSSNRGDVNVAGFIRLT